MNELLADAIRNELTKNAKEVLRLEGENRGLAKVLEHIESSARVGQGPPNGNPGGDSGLALSPPPSEGEPTGGERDENDYGGREGEAGGNNQ